MKKKIVIISILACVLGVFSCLFFDWPNDEGSYGGEQRRIWNELINKEYNRKKHVQINPPGNFSNDLFKQSEAKLTTLREKQGPCWDIKPGAELSGLPLEGLSRRELMKLAPTDPDACLLLAEFSPVICDFPNAHLAYYGKRQRFQQAALLKRPGAEFLVQVFDYYERKLPELPKISIDENKAKEISPGQFDFLKELGSYAEFLECMRKGDYRLMKALCLIDPNFLLSPEAEELRSCLWRKVDSGDMDAAADLAEITFLYRYDQILYDRIGDELSRERNGFILWLSRWVNIDKTAGRSAERDHLENLLDYVGQAADKGNLKAMYWWINNAPYLLWPYNEKTWERLFRYADQLIESGYIPMMRKIAYENFFCYPLDIISFYYPEKEWERIVDMMRENMIRRGEPAALLELLFRQHEGVECRFELNPDLGDDLEYLISEIRESIPGFFYNWEMYRSFFPAKADSSIREIFLATVEEASDSGNPQAQYVLARMIMDGYAGQRDRKDAVPLLERAWISCRKLDSHFCNGFMSFKSFHKLVVDNLMLLYVDRSGGTYNPSAAFELAKSFYEDRQFRTSNRRYYYLGLMHEKGIGTPLDIARALEYYREGANPNKEEGRYWVDIDCCRAMGRI